MVAILGLNVGVMSVAIALSSTQVTAGLGLGLFGVLSIIRLRSPELGQEAIGYYFTSLALGLLAGFDVQPRWVTPVLMSVIVATMLIGDHPRLFARIRHQRVELDTAFTNEADLVAHLTALLDSEILGVDIDTVDLVNDTTSVQVRYRIRVTP